MDYCFTQALKYNSNGIKTFIDFYDINCQYWTNLRRRVDSNPFLELPAGATFKKAIGQFHVHGHQDQCYARYSPLFIEGIGQIDGEIIETLWNPLNQISNSTRTMSTAHRKEIINNHMNDSNWKKLVHIGMYNTFV